MTPPISLEVEKEFPYQRREWTVQRVGWCLMVAVLAVAMTGAFAKGPLARGQRTSTDGSLRLRYDRLARYQAPTELKIDAVRATVEEVFEVALDQEYLKGVTIEQILPEPRSASLQGNNVVYRFDAPDALKVAIQFRLKPQLAGPLRGSVTAGNESLEFLQFVYP